MQRSGPFRLSRYRVWALAAWCLLFGLIDAGAALALTDQAQKIFETSNNRVYQIQVIDIHSREKSVIGSGFLISSDGLFATNYHVISDLVDKPEHYRIEYHRAGMKKGSLTVRAIDVAHDLALLQGEDPGTSPLALGGTHPAQGGHVFSMGNPLDVGMVIIEGTFNGLVGEAPYQHILLSAPLNPGMSGGPAFDTQGKVVGVNVAIEGNDLSYLVPVEYLVQLEKKFREGGELPNWAETIQNQVLEQYTHAITKALKQEWEIENFGSLRVPKNIMSPVIKCWGKSREEDPETSKFYFYGYKTCQSDKSIFLSSELHTGTIGYAFIWMESQSLSPLEFYKRYSQEFARGRFYDSAPEDEVTAFRCQNHFVKLAGRDWKGAYCVRRYKKYPRLHDVFVSFAILGDTPRKYIIQVGLTGLSEPLARRFLRKFLGDIEWAG